MRWKRSAFDFIFFVFWGTGEEERGRFDDVVVVIVAVRVDGGGMRAPGKGSESESESESEDDDDEDELEDWEGLIGDGASNVALESEPVGLVMLCFVVLAVLVDLLPEDNDESEPESDDEEGEEELLAAPAVDWPIALPLFIGASVASTSDSDSLDELNSASFDGMAAGRAGFAV